MAAAASATTRLTVPGERPRQGEIGQLLGAVGGA